MRFTTSMVAGQPVTAEIVASTNGLLNAWIDWNGNGDWSDAGDQILTNKPLVAGTNLVTFMVFPAATASNTFRPIPVQYPARDLVRGNSLGRRSRGLRGPGHPRSRSGRAHNACPEPVAVGSNLTYTVTVQNLGPSLATGVGLTNTLPEA